MGMALRASLFVSAFAALGACASNPEHGAAPIDFRGSAPVARGPAPGSVMASVVPPSTQQPRFSPSAPVAPPPLSDEPPPLQLVADLGPGVGLSATDEARGMAPEAGGRPGGSRRLGPDDVSARMVTVMSGDTLYDISRRYNVNMRALIETNQLQAPYALNVGATIQLPPPNVHVVSRGETLYSVSRRYNVDTRSLALLNGLVRPWTVYPGDELLLPPLACQRPRCGHRRRGRSRTHCRTCASFGLENSRRCREQSHLQQSPLTNCEEAASCASLPQGARGLCD